MATNLLQALGFQAPGGFNPDDPYGSAAPLPPVVNAPQMNPMQGLNIAPAAPPAPMMAPEIPAAPAAAPAGTRPARSRSSFLDTIGRISDVLAKVGGADALYQPTLDARQDREIALGDHDRSVDMDKLKRSLSVQALQSGQGTLDDTARGRIGKAVHGLQAIVDANPQADVASIWPILATQAGLPPERAAEIGQAIAANPGILAGLAGATGVPDEKEKYAGSVVYGTDANGKLVAYQPGTGANPGRNILPAGINAVDPQKFLNLGGTTVGVGVNTGKPTTIMPNSEAPGKAADRASRVGIAANHDRTMRDIAGGRNATTITVAGMPARAQPGKGAASKNVDPTNGLALITNIENGFRDLHGLKALPGDDSGVVGNVLSALGRTHLGQAVGEQAGSAAAQRRLAVNKNIAMLQQDLIKSLPASATRTKFEQEIVGRSLPDPSKMSYATAQGVLAEYRTMYQKAARDAAAELARKAPAAAPARTVQPRTGKPAAAGGWSVVGVSK